MEFKDYYKILGVDRHADQKAINQAFRRLARKYHPDVNKGKGAEDRFKEINEAHQALNDEQKRAQYDQIYDAYKSGVPLNDLFGGGGAPRGWSGPGGVTFRVGDARDFQDVFGQGGGFSDFFQQLFGFGRRGGAGSQPDGWPGAAADETSAPEAVVEITLDEAYHGAQRQIELPGGKRIDVKIPRGVRSGQTIRLPGAAGRRDIYLLVQVLPHSLFERADDDLTIEVPVTIAEAALGAKIEVPTLDGKMTVTVPPETQTGRRLRLKGLGMPHARGDGRGDLYVRMKVVTPTGLTKRQRELFEELLTTQTENPRAGLKL
jgi:curved DNA-binding protein